MHTLRFLNFADTNITEQDVEVLSSTNPKLKLNRMTLEQLNRLFRPW